jgi:hypothetical protein
MSSNAVFATPDGRRPAADPARALRAVSAADPAWDTLCPSVDPTPDEHPDRVRATAKAATDDRLSTRARPPLMPGALAADPTGTMVAGRSSPAPPRMSREVLQCWAAAAVRRSRLTMPMLRFSWFEA